MYRCPDCKRNDMIRQIRKDTTTYTSHLNPDGTTEDEDVEYSTTIEFLCIYCGCRSYSPYKFRDRGNKCKQFKTHVS